MVRLAKTEKSSSAPVASVVPVVAAIADIQAAAPAVAKKAKKEKTVAPAVSASVPVSAAPVVSEVANNSTPAVEANTVSYSSVVNEINAQLQQISSFVSNVKNNLKIAEKLYAKELKVAQKSSKAKKSSGNKSPSGFTKPSRISDELASFLGKATGTEMARTEVSKELHKYIKDNNLQLQTNRRTIVPDAKLSTLLRINDTTVPLTYFNLQQYISHLFDAKTISA